MFASKAGRGLFVLILVSISLSACSPAARSTPALTPISVQLQWTHQAEFAGLYAADQLGYYAAEGLAVNFLQGGPDIDNLAAVRDHKAQFGTASGNQLIVARAAGMPLRAIAAIYRRNPTVFFSLKKLGITRPQDFAGKKIRTPANLIPTLHAMTARVGLSPDQYTEIEDLPSDIKLFASGEVPVWGGYINGIVISIQQAGYEINMVSPDNYGVHSYADSLIAADDTIDSQPDLTLRFLRASLKGWTYAVENPEKMGELVAKYELNANLKIENLCMIASLPLVNTGEDHIGWMRPEIWAGMEKTLADQKVLTAPMDVTQVYTTSFLEKIYGK